MKNSDMPVMPCVQCVKSDHKGFPHTDVIETHGLTKREHFAGLAWAALLGATERDGDWAGTDAGAAKQAIKETDIFLAELEKKL